jgi:type I restriction enzyme M protein
MRNEEHEMMTLDELKSLLWGAAVLLRGKINATGYKEYIFPLVFFKRISIKRFVRR